MLFDFLLIMALNLQLSHTLREGCRRGYATSQGFPPEVCCRNIVAAQGHRVQTRRQVPSLSREPEGGRAFCSRVIAQMRKTGGYVQRPANFVTGLYAPDLFPSGGLPFCVTEGCGVTTNVRFLESGKVVGSRESSAELQSQCRAMQGGVLVRGS